MARKTYSEEFRRDAVELYRSSSGATVVGIAGDLGIMSSTLSAWLKAAGVAVRSPRRPVQTDTPLGEESPAQEVSRLRARVGELEANERKLNTERDILRAAAKYFAGETNW